MPTLLAGKYRLTRRLGAGGTGEVYVARDLRLQRDVAVKTLSGESVRRLMALQPEACAMATLTHPAAAQVYGVEFWRGRSFLVVEFLAGGTLADRLRRGAVPAPQAVAVVATLADALAALHDAGYLHRDIKPSNIGFTSDGSPKLLDFGLSREADDVALAGGTPQYASPEVLSGQPAGHADDVWSLCVVLYEMVAGRHPFTGPRVDEVTDRIVPATHRRQRPDAGRFRAAAGRARVRRVRADGPACVAAGDGARWPTRSAPCSERENGLPSGKVVRFLLLTRYLSTQQQEKQDARRNYEEKPKTPHLTPRRGRLAIVARSSWTIAVLCGVLMLTAIGVVLLTLYTGYIGARLGAETLRRLQDGEPQLPGTPDQRRNGGTRTAGVPDEVGGRPTVAPARHCRYRLCRRSPHAKARASRCRNAG